MLDDSTPKGDEPAASDCEPVGNADRSSRRNVASKKKADKLTPALAWLQAVRNDPRVTRAEWCLAAALYTHMDADGGNCRPGNGLLARETRCKSEGTIRNVRSGLAKRGYLRVNHHQKNDRYVPLIGGLSLKDDAKRHSTVTPTVTPRSAEGVREGVIEGVKENLITTSTVNGGYVVDDSPSLHSPAKLEALTPSGSHVPVSSHGDTVNGEWEPSAEDIAWHRRQAYLDQLPPARREEIQRKQAALAVRALDDLDHDEYDEDWA